MTSHDLKVAMNKLLFNSVYQDLYKGLLTFCVYDFLAGILFNLINVINNIKIAGEGITRSGDFIYEILGQVRKSV